MPDIGAIVGSAFRLVRDRPGAVALWGAVAVAGGLSIAAVRAELGIGSGVPAGEMPRLDLLTLLAGLLLDALETVLQAIVLTATFRASIEPRGATPAELQLGPDELRVAVMLLVLKLLFAAATLYGALGGVFLTSLTYLASGGSGDAASVAAFALGAALIAGLVFLAVRLSVTMPLVLVRGRIGLDEGWERTRGHFWSLFACFLLVILALIGIWLMATIAVMGVDLTNPSATAAGGNWAVWFAQTLRNGGWPRVVIGVAVDCLLTGISIALIGGTMAQALKRLPAAGASHAPA